MMTKSNWQRRMTTSVIGLAIVAGLVGCTQEPTLNADGEIAATEESSTGWFGSSDPVTYTLGTGEPIIVRTTSTLSTKANQTGEQFVASLEQPLQLDGMVVAPKGSKVTGTIAGSDPGGRVKGVAQMRLALTELVVGGKVYPISSSTFVQAAKATVTKDAQKVGIGAGIGAAIGAVAGGGSGALKGAGLGGGAGAGVVLGTHGDAAVVPAESVITFTLAGPLTVQVD
jgi:hypothetical protein